MFCTHCGAPNAESSRFCSRCGQPLAAGSISPGDLTPATAAVGVAAPSSAPAAAGPVYAGFWRRVGAYVIDYFILFVAAVVIGIALGIAGVTEDSLDGLSFLFGLFGFWLYKALLESGPQQATWGKRAVGIQVIDLQGRRIGFGRATGRHFASFLSSLTLGIGFVMAAFTARRQTLHDMIAGTLVVRRGTQTGAQGEPLPVAATPMPGWAIALIVLVAMVPILGGVLAAIAIPAYQDYTVRVQVTEGLTLASDYKAAVAEAWVETPAEFSEINSESLRLALNPASLYVAEIEVVSGAVLITYGDAASSNIDGKTLVLVPAVNDDGDLGWACGYGSPAVGYEAVFEDYAQYTDIEPKYLPAACRAGAGTDE